MSRMQLNKFKVFNKILVYVSFYVKLNLFKKENKLLSVKKCQVIQIIQLGEIKRKKKALFFVKRNTILKTNTYCNLKILSYCIQLCIKVNVISVKYSVLMSVNVCFSGFSKRHDTE